MQIEKKYLIFVDSNFIRRSASDNTQVPLSTEWINSIINFIKEHDLEGTIQLVVPEIVIEEIIAQKLEKIYEEKENLKQIEKKHKMMFGIEGINISEYDSYDYEKFFRDKCENFIKENDLRIAKIPNIDLKTVIKRAVNKKPPFKKSDNGFKDTIIWHSILSFAEKEKNPVCIFCTSDEIFKSDELKNEIKIVTREEMQILGGQNEVKEFLVSQLRLDLKWLRENKKIKDKIGEKMDEIIKLCNLPVVLCEPPYHNIMEYKLTDKQFVSINDTNLVFEIDLKIKINYSYKNFSNPYISSYFYSEYEKPRILLPEITTRSSSILIKLTLNKKNEEIRIVSVSREFPSSPPFLRLPSFYQNCHFTN